MRTTKKPPKNETVRRPEVVELAKKLHAENPRRNMQSCIVEAKARITSRKGEQ